MSTNAVPDSLAFTQSVALAVAAAGAVLALACFVGVRAFGPGGLPLLTLLMAGGILGVAMLALGGGLALACTLSRRHFARTRTTSD